MKKILYSILIILIHVAVEAQQIPQVSNFTYDNLRINPASAGSMDMVCLTGIYRDQMSNFPGNPKNFIVSGEMPFTLFGTRHGVGLSFVSDKIGFNADISPNLSYAYRFNIGDGTFGIGIQAGFIQSALNPDWVTMDGSSVTDPKIPNNDSEIAFTMGAGLFYRTEDLYFGVSSLNLNSPEIITPAENGESTYNLNRHYYVTAGYRMQLSNPAWEIHPAILLKSDGVSTDMDLNLTCVYNKKVWGGVSYRTGEAVVGMIGLELFEGLKIGYSYDAQTSSLMKYTQGTHEFVLNYCFKLVNERAPEKYKSIRFL